MIGVVSFFKSAKGPPQEANIISYDFSYYWTQTHTMSSKTRPWPPSIPAWAQSWLRASSLGFKRVSPCLVSPSRRLLQGDTLAVWWSHYFQLISPPVRLRTPTRAKQSLHPVRWSSGLTVECHLPVVLHVTQSLLEIL